MGGFTKFDPHAFLESEAPGRIPAKAAKLAKPFHEPDRTLATLAALAAHGPGSQNPAAYHARAELLAPLFAPMSPADGEPSFGKPYATRCGRVEERDGPVLHFCVECGAWGAFGYGVKLRAGELGRWYCAAHARAHTVEAIETLVAMLGAESERTRVAAAEALLSRGWGTPTAHVETGPPGSFADALDAVKLRAQSDH